MRVLVTGATGFVGQSVLAQLRNAHDEVHAVTSKDMAKEERIVWHRANLLSASEADRLIEVVRPTHLVHLAWYAVHQKFWTSPENLSWLSATVHLVRAFAERGGERIVAAGSCAEYDWSYGHCVEDLTPLKPRTLYGACKHAAQAAISEYCSQMGVALAWARLFNMFGPHEHETRFVASIVRSVLRGKAANCSHSEFVRDFMFISDVARALLILTTTKETGSFNVASGIPIALGDLASQIGHIVGRPELIRMKSESSADPRVLTADVGKMSRLGFSPAYAINGALRSTIDWWSLRLTGKETENCESDN